jgi:hypothetical protein
MGERYVEFDELQGLKDGNSSPGYIQALTEA